MNEFFLINRLFTDRANSVDWMNTGPCQINDVGKLLLLCHVHNFNTEWPTTSGSRSTIMARLPLI